MTLGESVSGEELAVLKKQVPGLMDLGDSGAERWIWTTAWLRGGMFQVPTSVESMETILERLRNWSTKLDGLQSQNEKLKQWVYS